MLSWAWHGRAAARNATTTLSGRVETIDGVVSRRSGLCGPGAQVQEKNAVVSRRQKYFQPDISDWSCM